MKLETATMSVRMDEPATLLQELNQPSEDYRSVRRWQYITVVRNDRSVVCRIDLGPAKRFKARQFNIVGGGRDLATGRYFQDPETVASLRDMADQMRDPSRDIAREFPDVLGRDWLSGYHDERDIRKRKAVGRKVFRSIR